LPSNLLEITMRTLLAALLATTARYEHINPYGQYRFEVKKGARVHGASVTVVQE
jgi:hypothetical protein